MATARGGRDYSTRYTADPSPDDQSGALRESLLETKDKLDQFFKSTENQHPDLHLHHRIIDPDSLKQISLIAGIDMDERLKALWDTAAGAGTTVDHLTQARAINDTLSTLADNGVMYTPTQDDRRKNMEFHDAYRGDRLKEAFTQDLGQRYVPTLDALTSNTGHMETLLKFATEIPEADSKRLIGSLSSYYANRATDDETFKRLKAQAAESIATAMVNHSG